MAKKPQKQDRSALETNQTAEIAWLTNQWQEHPVVGLTPARLHRLLTDAEQGNLQAQADLFCDMEERDGHIFSEMDKRKKAINSLDWNSGQDVNSLREGYDTFKIEKNEKEIAAIANRHGLPPSILKDFIDKIMRRMIFDGEKLTDLLEPLDLSWKERRTKELALMIDLVPHLKKQAQGREISGLAAYE